MSDQDASKVPPVRFFIDDWPYASEYLQATFDPDLIGRHGVAVLRRSLIDGRTVCFLGSGVSMAYGRVGWANMVRTLTSAGQGNPPNASRASTPPWDLIAGLRAHLEALRLNDRPPADLLQSGRYPAAFQFSEQIEMLERNGPAPSEDPSLRDRARDLLYDDRGHALLLLEGVSSDLLTLQASRGGAVPDDQREARRKAVAKLLGADELHRMTRRGADEAADASWQQPFNLTRERVLELREQLDQADGPAVPYEAKQAADKLLKLVFDALPPDEGAQIPLRRFVVPALARLVFDPDAFERNWSKSVTPRGRALRSRELPAWRDPLLTLSRDLQITRFLTTNYDLDIERMLRDRGFRIERPPVADDPGAARSAETPSRHTVSVNALGTRARDSLFDPKHAAELIDFAVHTGGFGYSVMHLHGRATDGDRMIITERDYLNQYLQRGDDAEIASDAISIAFGANPMLFVGSGMSEDDILRPLRQFVTERKSRTDRAAVVLLPAAGSRARQIEEAIALYARYGVYAVHYGIGIADGSEVRWLSHFLAVLKAVGDLLSALKGVLKQPGTVDRPRLVDLVRREVSAHSAESLFGLSAQKGGGCVTVEPSPVEGGWPSLREPARIDNDAPERDAAQVGEMAFELRILNAVLHFALDAAWSLASIDLADLWLGVSVPAVQPAASACFSEAALNNRSTLRLTMAHLSLVDGLRDAFVGIALCVKLTALRAGWSEWQLGRLQLPLCRPSAEPELAFGFTVPSSSGSKLDLTGVHPAVPVLTRHAIALARSPIELAGNPPMTGPIGQLAFPYPRDDRFFSEAPSQTLRTLYRAMTKARKDRDSDLNTHWDQVGRRLFLLLAPRGVGKGHRLANVVSEKREPRRVR